ncbi:MAG: L,D-transpeptidase family protein [Clostridiaceae bacterium]|nr:L,D-transpeptidase family protein [Clostridiaceae bacterium]
MIRYFRLLLIGCIFFIVIAFGGFTSAKSADFQIPDTGYALYIDLDIHKMTVYLDGQVFKTYPVSGGANETPSPVGLWYVDNISDWGGGFGGSWIGLNVPWGVYGIHGNKNPWFVGKTNVSHGCIRMINKDVFEIRQRISVGTVVFIKHDALPFRNMGKGVKGSDVYDAQMMLYRLGFYTGTIDGIFGNGMTHAVKSFQKTYSLPIDGVIHKETYDKITEQANILEALLLSRDK